jgi:hypothetical protein
MRFWRGNQKSADYWSASDCSMSTTVAKKTSLQITTNEPIKVWYIIPAPEKGGGLDWDERHRLCSECSL